MDTNKSALAEMFFIFEQGKTAIRMNATIDVLKEIDALLLTSCPHYISAELKNNRFQPESSTGVFTFDQRYSVGDFLNTEALGPLTDYVIKKYECI
jgi:hypothetical protein